MQSLDLPPERNPYGHTPAEILAALRGVTGSRRFSFRYELLDRSNQVVEELTEVESCTVTQNWLATVKRSAQFSLRSQGRIDFLSDRIKPWARLHMPPVLWAAGLVLDGSPGNYASAPHHPALSADGDLSLRVDATRDWQPGGGIRILMAKADHDVDPGNLSYYLSLNDSGQLRLTWSTTGSDFNTMVASVLPSVRVANGRLAVRADLDADNGSGQHEVVFWTAPTIDGPWTQLGTTQVGSGTVSIHQGTAPLEVGSRSVGTLQLWTGRIHAARMYSDGTLVAAPDFWGQTAGTGSFLDRIGHLWAVHGQAAIEGSVEVSDSYVEWPQGVFLLSTPQRQTDNTGTVSRVVQGYDQLQIYADDLIADRFAAPSGASYTETVLNLLSTTGAESVVSDDFNRSIQASGGWGTTDRSGHGWTLFGDGFGIVSGGIGYLVEESAGSGFGAMVDVDLDNVEIRTAVEVNQPAPDAGVLARLVDFNNFYEFIVDSFTPTYEIWRCVGGSFTELVSTAIPEGAPQPDDVINIRAQCTGSTLRAKFWWNDDPEPAEWTLSTTDGTHVSGRVGAVMYGAGGAYFAGFHRFTATDLLSGVTYVPSDRVLSATKEWEPGTSVLGIINELLGAVNYESLSFDEDGRAVIRPYVAPGDRSPEYTYADDETSLTHPQVVQELDLFSVPNRWVLVVSEPDRDPIVSTYTNNDPSSPTSTVRRGRVITDFRTETEAADQATLDEKVSRLAFEASQIFETVQFTTGFMPVHSGNDVYRIEFSPLAVSAQFSEHSWSTQLAPGARMQHRARRVVSIAGGS